jgi:hypothetical protein
MRINPRAKQLGGKQVSSRVGWSADEDAIGGFDLVHHELTDYLDKGGGLPGAWKDFTVQILMRLNTPGGPWMMYGKIAPLLLRTGILLAITMAWIASRCSRLKLLLENLMEPIILPRCSKY